MFKKKRNVYKVTIWAIKELFLIFIGLKESLHSRICKKNNHWSVFYLKDIRNDEKSLPFSTLFQRSSHLYLILLKPLAFTPNADVMKMEQWKSKIWALRPSTPGFTSSPESDKSEGKSCFALQCFSSPLSHLASISTTRCWLQKNFLKIKNKTAAFC